MNNGTLGGMIHKVIMAAGFIEICQFCCELIFNYYTCWYSSKIPMYHCPWIVSLYFNLLCFGIVAETTRIYKCIAINRLGINTID